MQAADCFHFAALWLPPPFATSFPPLGLRFAQGWVLVTGLPTTLHGSQGIGSVLPDGLPLSCRLCCHSVRFGLQLCLLGQPMHLVGRACGTVSFMA